MDQARPSAIGAAEANPEDLIELTKLGSGGRNWKYLSGGVCVQPQGREVLVHTQAEESWKIELSKRECCGNAEVPLQNA